MRKAQGEPEAGLAGDLRSLPAAQHGRFDSRDAGRPDCRAGRQARHAARVLLRSAWCPRGSKDPFALRRAAQGVVKILVEAKLDYHARSIWSSGELRDFLLERIQYYFREVRGFKYDEVNAVLASGMRHSRGRRSAAGRARRGPAHRDFEPLAASFKRIQNILKQANFAARRRRWIQALLEAWAGTRALRRLPARARDRARQPTYPNALEAIASLRPAVDQFFDKVLVNAPDPNVRDQPPHLVEQFINRIFDDRRLFGNRHLRRHKNEKLRL